MQFVNPSFICNFFSLSCRFAYPSWYLRKRLWNEFSSVFVFGRGRLRMSNTDLMRRAACAILIASAASLRMLPLSGYPGVYYFEDVKGSRNEQEYSKNYYVIMIPVSHPLLFDLIVQ
uniref:Uncharacterized protein n=1 Tax=Ascaris lumbricoides TaxID=6252 RepID=A0A0M3IA96_ASCLU